MEFSREELAEARRQLGSTLHKLRETVKTLRGKEQPSAISLRSPWRNGGFRRLKSPIPCWNGNWIAGRHS